MTELATTDAHGGTLVLRADQPTWTPTQMAALSQLGVADAPQGDLDVFHHVCQRTGLDPFARQIYMIARWDQQASRNKWTIQTGIDGFRVVADRRAEYRGQVGPQWCGTDGVWTDVWVADTAPIAARVGVKRSDFDGPIWGVAMFREFCQTKKGGELTAMWRDKGAHQIAKCAEAQALRKAFPQDLGGLYTDDEMAHLETPRARGRVVIEHDTQVVTADELTGVTTPPQDAGPRASQDQNKKLFALLREAGIEDRNSYASQLLNRDISSYGQLTAADASRLIDNLEAILADDTTDGGTS